MSPPEPTKTTPEVKSNPNFIELPWNYKVEGTRLAEGVKTTDGYLLKYSRGIFCWGGIKDILYDDITCKFKVTVPNVQLLSINKLWKLKNWRLPVECYLRSHRVCYVLVPAYKDTCLHRYQSGLSRVLRVRRSDGATKSFPHICEVTQPLCVGEDVFGWVPLLSNSRYTIYKVSLTACGSDRDLKPITLSSGSCYWQFMGYTIFKNLGGKTKYFRTSLIDQLQIKMAFEKMTPSWLAKFKYYFRKYAADLNLETSQEDLLDVMSICLNKKEEVQRIQGALDDHEDLYKVYADSLDLKKSVHVPKVVVETLSKATIKIAEKLGDKYPSISSINKRVHEILTDESGFNRQKWMGILQVVVSSGVEIAATNLPIVAYAGLEIAKSLHEKVKHKKIKLENALEDLQYQVSNVVNRVFPSQTNVDLSHTEVFLDDSPTTDFQEWW